MAMRNKDRLDFRKYNKGGGTGDRGNNIITAYLYIEDYNYNKLN